MSLWSWVKNVFKPSIELSGSLPPHVLVRLPSGHQVWIEKEDYELFRGGNYYLIWNFNQNEARIIHFHYIHTLEFNDILVWGRDGMATGITDHGAYGIHGWNREQLRRQVTNPDHLPYDPKMGF
jgi:hypothetical protein